MNKLLVTLLALVIGAMVVGCDKITPTNPFKSNDDAPAGLKPNPPKPDPAPVPGVTPTDPFKPNDAAPSGLKPNPPKPDPAPKPGVTPTNPFAEKGA